MSYALLQNLIVALIGVAALLFLLDRIAPSLRRRLSTQLQHRPATAALGRWLQPAAGGGHCGSSSGNSCDTCGGCGSSPGKSPQQH